MAKPPKAGSPPPTSGRPRGTRRTPAPNADGSVPQSIPTEPTTAVEASSNKINASLPAKTTTAATKPTVQIPAPPVYRSESCRPGRRPGVPAGGVAADLKVTGPPRRQAGAVNSDSYRPRVCKTGKSRTCDSKACNPKACSSEGCNSQARNSKACGGAAACSRARRQGCASPPVSSVPATPPLPLRTSRAHLHPHLHLRSLPSSSPEYPGAPVRGDPRQRRPPPTGCTSACAGGPKGYRLPARTSSAFNPQAGNPQGRASGACRVSGRTGSAAHGPACRGPAACGPGGTGIAARRPDARDHRPRCADQEFRPAGGGRRPRGRRLSQAARGRRQEGRLFRRNQRRRKDHRPSVWNTGLPIPSAPSRCRPGSARAISTCGRAPHAASPASRPRRSLRPIRATSASTIRNGRRTSISTSSSRPISSPPTGRGTSSTTPASSTPRPARRRSSTCANSSTRPRPRISSSPIRSCCAPLSRRMQRTSSAAPTCSPRTSRPAAASSRSGSPTRPSSRSAAISP